MSENSKPAKVGVNAASCWKLRKTIGISAKLVALRKLVENKQYVHHHFQEFVDVCSHFATSWPFTLLSKRPMAISTMR